MKNEQHKYTGKVQPNLEKFDDRGLSPYLPSKTIGNYIADTLSTHSRGSTVDLTIVEKNTDNELEMGTIFDFFDKIANTANADVSSEAKKNRLLLKSIMEKYGFAGKIARLTVASPTLTRPDWSAISPRNPGLIR